MLHYVVIALSLGAQPSPEDVSFVQNMVAQALARDERIDVVTSDALCGSEDCLVRVAHETAAQLIVFGDVRKLGKRVFVSLNLFDARDGRVSRHAATEARNEIALRKEVDQLASHLLDEQFTPRPKLVVLKLQTTSPAVDDDERPPYFAWGLTAAGAVGLATGSVLALTFVEDPRDEQNGIGREVTGAAGVLLAAASAATVAVGAYFLLGD